MFTIIIHGLDIVVEMMVITIIIIIFAITVTIITTIIISRVFHITITTVIHTLFPGSRNVSWGGGAGSALSLGLWTVSVVLWLFSSSS